MAVKIGNTRIMVIPDFSKNSIFDDPDRSAYLTDTECIAINDDLTYTKYRDAANHFFFHGGKLEDQKLTPKVKPAGKLYKAVQCLLRSYAPSHDVKIATVAKLLKEHTNEL